MTTVADVMTRGVRTLSPSDTVVLAAQAMDELNVGVIPVCDGEKLVGMVTDRDIVVRGVAQEADTKTLKLADVMSTNVRCANQDEDIDDVLNQMADTQIRRMPVVDGHQRLVGIVTLGDIAAKDPEDDEDVAAVAWRYFHAGRAGPVGPVKGQRECRRRLGCRKAAAPAALRTRVGVRPRPGEQCLKIAGYLTGVSVWRMIPPPLTLPSADPAPRMRCTQASRSDSGWALQRWVAFWVKLFPPLLSSRPRRASSSAAPASLRQVARSCCDWPLRQLARSCW